MSNNNIEDDENNIKCIVIGDSGVGKSCIIYRYISNTFESKSLSTLGAMFYKKEIESKKRKKYNLQLWDTAGQEVYKTITSLYYRGMIIRHTCSISGIRCFEQKVPAKHI